MNKCKILLITFLCLMLLSGCGKNSDKKDGESNDKKAAISYTYNNEPKFVIYTQDTKYGSKYGYIDKTGKVVIEPQYYTANPFKDGVAVVQKVKNDLALFGLIDSQGKLILEPEYDAISDFSEDLAVVKSAGKSGYANKKGKFIIYPKYDYGYIFKEGLAKVIVENKIGFINKKGDYVIYPKYDNTDTVGFNNGFAFVKKDGKTTLINKNGEVVKVLNYDTVEDFPTHKYKVCKDDKYGLISSSGEVIIEPKYLMFTELDKEGKYIAVTVDGRKYGVIDKNGKEIIPFKYDGNIAYDENLFAVYDPSINKTLMLDLKGKVLAKSDYISAGDFTNGLCVVQTEDGTARGYINKKAEVVIPLKFFVAGAFNNGLAFVTEKLDDGLLFGYIDTKGNYVWKNKYSYSPQADIMGYEEEKPKQQVATKKTTQTTKKYTNYSNNNYYNYDYGYNNNYYYKPSKSQDVKDAEDDILN